jgi:oleandomycin transport system permease protein
VNALTAPAPAVGAGIRRRPLALLRHSAVLARRGLVNTIRTPEALIDVTIQPLIFLLLFTYVFGGAIAANGSQQDYLRFLLPGILAQTIAMGSVAIGTNLNTDIEKGVFDRFRSLPIARSAPLVGAVLADVIRYVIVCVVLLGTGYALGFRADGTVLEVLAGCVLAVAFALCFCWVSVFVGLVARTSGAVQGILFLFILPLSFGSSTFVPASTMPGWLQAFVDVNPLTHLIGVERALLTGGALGSHLTWMLVWMAGLLATFVPLALRAYGRRV